MIDMSWLDVLTAHIEKAKDGDSITVRSEAAKELAERARLRMCPEKKIIFEVKENDQWNQ